MALSMQEEIRLKAAFMEVTRERRLALEKMFAGTQLKVKDYKALAVEAVTAAKQAKKVVSSADGVHVPSLDMPSLNPDIFKGIDLPKLSKIKIPGLTLPDFPIARIPDINLGSLPGFDLPRFRLNLKGILRHKDLLPTINLRAMIWGLSQRWPHISLPSLVLDLQKLMGIDLPGQISGFKDAFPDFFSVDLRIPLPNLKLPDVNITMNLPNPSLPEINLPDLSVPGLNMSEMLKIPGFDKAMRLLVELFDVDDLQDILAELGQEFMLDFVSSALPVVQQVKSGALAAKEWGKSAQEFYRSCKTTKHKNALIPGDARAACDAIRRLLRESSADHAAVATIRTTQLGTSTAGLFADLGGVTGPAVSAASALAKLCHKLVVFGAKYKEMKRVNEILRTGNGHQLNSDLFNVSPLLGCYFIVNNDHMIVLNVIADNLMEDDWMNNAEKNKREHLDPLIKDAQRFIDKSRYVLTPLRATKGMYVKRDFISRLKEGATLYAKKKVGLAPKDAKVSSHRYIG
ncbi:hypothetical protein [Parendozoicomonas haliclonae]|uniref:Uncharacterized protein n=1 Tax=Parendozoicomonas haliclonae TaxID=1960125 RepID=A0A1X7AHD4_9GAMM|nr:hypothetical protein [Parendozoicomonas haliclonae]SMA41591.1 hypothetical protein EHSB41UT_01278 [Parendozoicomonas haliclonae]